MDAKKELLSLYLQNRQNKDPITFYFDHEGQRQLGSIIITIN